MAWGSRPATKCICTPSCQQSSCVEQHCSLRGLSESCWHLTWSGLWRGGVKALDKDPATHSTGQHVYSPAVSGALLSILLVLFGGLQHGYLLDDDSLLLLELLILCTAKSIIIQRQSVSVTKAANVSCTQAAERAAQAEGGCNRSEHHFPRTAGQAGFGGPVSVSGKRPQAHSLHPWYCTHLCPCGSPPR